MFIINANAIKVIDKYIPELGVTDIIPIASVDKSLQVKYPTKKVIHIYRIVIPADTIANTALFIKLKTAAIIANTNIPATHGEPS